MAETFERHFKKYRELKENRPYAPPGEYSECSAPPVSVAILNAVK